MRIIPFALIAVGVFGVLEYFGFIDPAFVQLFWPLLLVGVGVLMLARGRAWRANMHERMQDRWERRMHRHFGPGWANLSEEERQRFRAGMRQWHSRVDGGGTSTPTPARDDTSSSAAQPPAAGEQR